MKITTLLAAFVASSALTVASAQTGTDSCTTPDAIAGQGLFAFDNSAASTGAEGQAEVICYAFGSSTVDNDVWFAWTADATGTAFIQTCNQTAVDTKIASYPGAGCPTNGSSIACNDDSCGLQSLISFPCSNGTVYTLQVGTFPGATGGTGSLDINITGPITNDDCSAPDAIAGQGNFPYNNSVASTGTEGQNEVACYAFGTSGIDNDIWFSWTADATGVATVSTCLSSQDTKIAAYPGGGCPTTGSSLACNDDTCGLQSEIMFNVTSGTSYMLQVGNFPGGSGGFSSVDIAISGSSGPGTAYCFCDTGNAPCGNSGTAGNGCANGSNTSGANLAGTGVASVGADTLVLVGTGMPANQPGLYFQGNNAVNGGAGLIFGDGIRCAGNGVVRLGVAAADGSGTSDTSGLPFPISVKGSVNPGDLRRYQLWYRDPAGSPCGALFNLTNGYEVQW